MVLEQVALIDNLQDPDGLLLEGGYEASTERYMAGVGGNTGNLAFVKGTTESLSAKVRRIGWGWSTEKVRDSADIIVISCANQLGAHADLGGWASALERFDRPVVLIGLGAQRPNYDGAIELPEGTIRFLQVVNDLRPTESCNIAVRGPFTKEVLQRYGHDGEVLGCPSLFISAERELGRTIAEKSSRNLRKIAIAAGNPYHAGSLKFEQNIIRWVEELGGSYVVQHPDAIVALALGQSVADEKLEHISNTLGFGDSIEARSWFKKNAYSFHESTTWLHFLRHFDAVAGARYHGVALGVQAGIPGLVVNIDSRTKELAETTGIPTLSASAAAEMPLEVLLEEIKWTPQQGAQFDTNRRILAKGLSDFLAANSLGASPKLVSLANS